MARVVLVWLTATVLLLISIIGVANASTLYVTCHLKNDWPPYKTGDDQTFTLPTLTRAIYDDYRAHCEFLAGLFEIEIRNEIDSSLEKTIDTLKSILGDDADFKKALELPAFGITVSLQSGGGDLNAALRIGRVLRDLQAQTVINGGDGCVSSCVFLLAGGVSRIVHGPVGVHRPYFTALSTKRTPAEVSQAYEQQRAMIIKYLNDMNVPTSLLDFMNETPPESIHSLTDAEITKYRLRGDDPIFNERVVAIMANMRGLTSAQYRQRLVEKDSICGSIDTICNSGTVEQIRECFDQRNTCADAVSWGLSIPEYLKKEKEMQRCPSFQESASVDAFTTCIKAAMLGK